LAHKITVGAQCPRHSSKGEDMMTREEFFNRLLDMVKDTDVEFNELLDDDGEGGVYVQFTNIQIEEE